MAYSLGLTRPSNRCSSRPSSSDTLFQPTEFHDTLFHETEFQPTLLLIGSEPVPQQLADLQMPVLALCGAGACDRGIIHPGMPAPAFDRVVTRSRSCWPWPSGDTSPGLESGLAHLPAAAPPPRIPLVRKRTCRTCGNSRWPLYWPDDRRGCYRLALPIKETIFFPGATRSGFIEPIRCAVGREGRDDIIGQCGRALFIDRANRDHKWIIGRRDRGWRCRCCPPKPPPRSR